MIAYFKENGKGISLTDGQLLSDNMTLEIPCAFPKWDETSESWVFNRDTWLDEAVRPLRDAALLAADNRIRRYDLQLRAGLTPKESAEKIDELLQYMQVLRDLPNNESLTPENLTWPEVP